MKLFEQGRIGSLATRNRIVMCPMGTGRLSEQEGGLQRVIDYYVARAAGGVGLIITGASIVDGFLPSEIHTAYTLLGLKVDHS